MKYEARPVRLCTAIRQNLAYSQGFCIGRAIRRGRTKRRGLATKEHSAENAKPKGRKQGNLTTDNADLHRWGTNPNRFNSRFRIGKETEPVPKGNFLTQSPQSPQRMKSLFPLPPIRHFALGTRQFPLPSVLSVRLLLKVFISISHLCKSVKSVVKKSSRNSMNVTDGSAKNAKNRIFPGLL